MSVAVQVKPLEELGICCVLIRARASGRARVVASTSIFEHKKAKEHRVFFRLPRAPQQILPVSDETSTLRLGDASVQLAR